MADDRCILDTGPLVSLLRRDDRDHEACVEFLSRFRGHLLTTESVLTEAVYLLGRYAGASFACLDFFVRGGAVLVPLTHGSLIRCNFLMNKYADVPMDFADATLVALAEEAKIKTVFTLDPRGFRVYRSMKNSAFHIVP